MSSYETKDVNHVIENDNIIALLLQEVEMCTIIDWVMRA